MHTFTYNTYTIEIEYQSTINRWYAYCRTPEVGLLFWASGATKAEAVGYAILEIEGLR